MARWKLMSPHYLNVPDTEWEYVEENKTNKKMVRKRFPVPRYLDPEDPGDFTQRNGDEGEVIVCWEGKGERNDHIFTGNPTPEMEPIDAEARKITAQFASTWHHPIESLPAQGGELFSQSLVRQFEHAIDAIVKKQSEQPVPNTPIGGVDPKAFEALQAQVAQLAQMNADLLSQLQSKVDPEPPLEDISEEDLTEEDYSRAAPVAAPALDRRV